MILTIHQPEHIPWMGFFNKLMYSEVYVALDNVQYRHRYFQNRNKVNSNGVESWINVPVITKGRRDTNIKDMEINNVANWRRKNWRTLQITYNKSNFFKKYSDYFEDLYAKEWENLSTLNLDIIRNMCSFFGIETEIKIASDLQISGQGPQLVVDICKHFKPDVYISGKSGIAGRGKDCAPQLENAGISVVYQKYVQPKYPTFCEYIPHLSALDLLFNHGPKSLDYIKDDGGWFYEQT